MVSTMNQQSLTERQIENIREQYTENGLSDALFEATLYQPDDVDQLEWLTQVFRDLDFINEDEEVFGPEFGGEFAVREVARRVDCPECGEETDHVIDAPSRVSTPTNIGRNWEVCVREDQLFVHNPNGGDHIGRETRR